MKSVGTKVGKRFIEHEQQLLTLCPAVRVEGLYQSTSQQQISKVPGRIDQQDPLRR
jgi:hypothetical protein